LLFEDGQRGIHKIDVRTAREILCQRGVRLVFLNACETGRGGTTDFNRGVAPALIAGGVPAVVANQFKVLDQSATEFSQHFYWALANGQTIGTAAREGRIAVNYSIAGENIDWAVPVVYARDPEGRICERREITREMLSAPLISMTARKILRTHHKKVAVWDVNHTLPRLSSTLATMNAAQRWFGFHLVDLSTPFGAWQRYKRSSLQLNANVTAERLRHKPLELGSDILLCVTEYPIMYEYEDEIETDLDVWWPAPDEDVNIVIISSSMPGFPRTGIESSRIVANVVVQGLSGLLARVPCHKRGPKSCPLYTDPERSIKRATARLEFDRACLKELRNTIGDDLSALQALLKVF
jgi:hypothetical protein